jgi:hypothetical protein
VILLNLLNPKTVAPIPDNHFAVVHPLDDAPEQKVDLSVLGPMPMTTSVRLSLWALRGYLIVMSLLVLYHVMDLARAFRLETH